MNTYWIFLFGIIPFIKEKDCGEKTAYYLFGLLPIIKIKRFENKIKYYLFGFLPLFKITRYGWVTKYFLFFIFKCFTKLDRNIIRFKKHFKKCKYKKNSVYVFYTHVKSSSLRYRRDNIVNAFIRRNIPVEVVIEGEEWKLDILLEYTKAVIAVRTLNGTFKRFYIKKFEEHNIPVIFDTDDLIFDIKYARNVGGIDLTNGYDIGAMYSLVEGYGQMVQDLKYATVTTEALKKCMLEFDPEIKVEIVRNTINKAQFDLAEKLNKNKTCGNKVKIVYLSGTKTHSKDFLEAKNAIQKILKKYDNVEFHLVGKLDLDDDFKVIKHPLMPYLEMLEFLSAMDINIAPLELGNVFCDCKSELKIFEAALVHVPTIASPADSYARISENGKDCLLAKNEDEWVKNFELLIENPVLRNEIGKNAYNKFVSMFYIENNVDKILNTYEKFITGGGGNQNFKNILDSYFQVDKILCGV